MAAPPGSDVSGFKRVREARESSAAAAVAKEPPTLRSDLARILLDEATHEKLCDVRLKSAIDGEEVPAVRAILGARSAPLLVLLRGGFAEGNSEVVKMQLRGATLFALVKYCYTDSFEMIPCSTFAPIYIELLAAANLYELKTLSSMVRKEVTRVLDSNHGLVGKYLQALVSTPNAKETSDGMGLLMDVEARIYRDMFGCLIANEDTCIFCLGLEALEFVVSKASCVDCSMADMFDLLKRWAEHANNRKRLSTDASSDLRRHISLQCLRPSFLRDVVVPTGLFGERQLASAYEQIAITAEAITAPQKFINVADTQKLCELKRLCGNGLTSPKYTTLVFVGDDRVIDYIMRNLGSNSCSSITDETKAEDKNAALNRLRDEAGHILITTYWEAQKFDIPRVDRVINYDMPATVEEYISGISYMVYAGCFGHDYATTFVNRRDHVAIRHIVELFTLHGLSFPVVLAKPNELVAAGMSVH